MLRARRGCRTVRFRDGVWQTSAGRGVMDALQAFLAIGMEMRVRRKTREQQESLASR